MDPIFWLGLSILLVAASVAAVLLAMIPAMKEMARAAQSAEKLFETLNRELPPTLEAIRLTSLELTELTDDVTDSVQGLGSIVQNVDGGVSGVRQQADQVKVSTKSVMAGVKAAWKTLKNEAPSDAEETDPIASPTSNSAIAGSAHAPMPQTNGPAASARLISYEGEPIANSDDNAATNSPSNQTHRT
jgi:uncharacterized protein YoxC